MPEVSITYCVPCRYQFKAIQDADAILKEFGSRLSALRLIPGDKGIYNVSFDGELLFSLDRAEHFPETEDLIETIRAKMPPTSTNEPNIKER
jgi:selenoprotein W-related protein